MNLLPRLSPGWFLFLLLASAAAFPRLGWAAAELVSVSTGNEQSFSAGSFFGRASATGRFVVFESVASEFASGDDNNFSDIFLRDRETGTTTRVTFGFDGSEPNGDSRDAVISADGRRIVFSSSASNLVRNDTNGAEDVFLFDQKTRKITRVSVGGKGTQAEGGGSIFPAISGNGRFVAYVSNATNLVPNDANGAPDVFVRDLQTRKTTRVSARPDGSETAAQGIFSSPSLSHTGRWVAFESNAADLVADDSNGASDVFVHDRASGTTILASRTTAGVQGNGSSVGPVLSADGGALAFGSSAPNLVEGGGFHVVVKDLRTGVAARPRPSANYSYGSALSADGSRIALVTQVGSAQEQVEVVDRATGEIFAPARLPNGDPAGPSNNPHLSADGRLAIFSAAANGIVPLDQNFTTDVLARPLYDTIGFFTPVFRAEENSGSVNVIVQREGVLNGAVSVQYSISAGGDTAIPGRDYAPVVKSGTLSWSAGDASSRLITIPLIDTAAADGYRVFSVALASPGGGAALGQRITQVVIGDTESEPVEDRVGHSLKISKIVARGTNWDTGVFRAIFTVHNPAPLPSFPGYLELQFDGALLAIINFDAIPARGEVIVDASANVGAFPDGDVFALLYEVTPAGGNVPQDSGYAAGFIDNGTAPPSGGTAMPNTGLKAPNFSPVTVKSVTIEGDATVNEGTSKAYTAKVTLSDGSTLANVSPGWRATAFSINNAGLFTAGDVAADKQVTLSATVTRNGVSTTGSRKITVKNVPATPVITSGLTAFATLGKPFIYRIAARHEPATFGAAGLPDGLAINVSTGVISGVPATDGPFPVQISAANNIGTDTETLNLTVSEPSPLTVNITGTGTVTPNLSGQLLDVGRTYKLLAKPGTDHLFAGWSNGVTSPLAALAFTMTPNLVLDAEFVPNPFLTRAGAYAGLIESEPPSHEGSGLILATITKTGLCSGKMILGGKTVRFKAQLAPDGTSPLITVTQRGAAPIFFSLQLDVATQSGELSGNLESGAIEAAITGGRALQDTASLAGKYTFVLPGPDAADDTGQIPDGSGFGTAIVNPKGKVKLSGRLGDGSPFNQAAPFIAGARSPFYVSLYRGGGAALGSMGFQDLATSDFSAEITWFKPERPTDAFYPAGWPAGIRREMLGARYAAPPVVPGLPPTDPDGNAAVIFLGGGLGGMLSQSLNITPSGAASAVAPVLERFSIRITGAKGLFGGSFIDLITGQSRRFSGAVQQKMGGGFGSFPGGGQRVGNVVLGF